MATVRAAADVAPPLAPRAEPTAAETRDDEGTSFSTTLATAHTRSASLARHEGGHRGRRADDAASTSVSAARGAHRSSPAAPESATTVPAGDSKTHPGTTGSPTPSDDDGASAPVMSTDASDATSVATTIAAGTIATGGSNDAVGAPSSITATIAAASSADARGDASVASLDATSDSTAAARAPHADATVSGDAQRETATDDVAPDETAHGAPAGAAAAPDTNEVAAARGMPTTHGRRDATTTSPPSSDADGGSPNAAAPASDGDLDHAAATASASSDAAAPRTDARNAALRGDVESRPVAAVVAPASDASRHLDATERATGPRHTAAGTHPGHHRGVVATDEAALSGQDDGTGTTDHQGGSATTGEQRRNDSARADARDGGVRVDGAGTGDASVVGRGGGSLARLTTGVGSETAVRASAGADGTVVVANGNGGAAVSVPGGDGAPPPPATHMQTAAGARVADTGISAWAERVVESVRVATLRGGGEMRLRLEPAGLGHIDVRITLAHDGIHASIVAEHDSTRTLLRDEQHLLHTALERSDMRLAGFSVDLGSGGSSHAFGDAEPRATGFGREAGAATELDTATNEIIQSPAEPGRLSVRV